MASGDSAIALEQFQRQIIVAISFFVCFFKEMVNLVQIPVFSAETPCVGSVCFQCPISVAGRVEWVTTTHPCTLLQLSSTPREL